MRTAAVEAALTTMPEFRPRRTAPPRLVFGAELDFASQLQSSTAGLSRNRAPAGGSVASDTARALPAERAQVLGRARDLLGVPYRWGGDSHAGMDCSAYVSRAWGVPRQTTDTLHRVADPIAKADLRAGDAMNLPTYRDATRHGHVRLFDRWADAGKTKMWVYEATADTGRAVHRVIDYDDRYQPMRLQKLATAAA